MKTLAFSIFFFLLFYAAISQDTINNFRKSPFKYHQNESKFSIAGGIIAGAGSRAPVIGATFDFDIFHILISLRLLHHPFMYDRYQIMTDRGAMIGYQYRNKKIIGSLAAGICSQNYFCNSGRNEQCYNNESEHYTAFSCKAGIDFAFSKIVAVGLVSHFSSNDREDIYTVMASFKLGFFRNK